MCLTNKFFLLCISYTVSAERKTQGKTSPNRSETVSAGDIQQFGFNKCGRQFSGDEADRAFKLQWG